MPSLSALRAFEAAARHQNQSAAARELNVTHAAINQHIRTLEAFFDMPLFERNGRDLELTSAGNRLFQSVGSGFFEIKSAVETLLSPEGDDRLRIAITPFLYELWLLPRIQSFWENHPELDVQFVASASLVDLKRDGFDLAIRFGDGRWSPYSAEWLFAKKPAVYAAPAYLERHPELAKDWVNATWLRADDAPEYDHFYAKHGIDFETSKHQNFQTTHEARAALIAGIGVLPHAAQFLAREEAFGLVTKVADFEMDSDIGYYILRKNSAPNAAAEKFVNWLRAVEDVV